MGKLTQTQIKNIFTSKFFIPYSDVSKHKLSKIEKRDDVFLVYIENPGCPPQLFEPLVEEINNICNAANLKLNKKGYNASIWGFDINYAKIRIMKQK